MQVVWIGYMYVELVLATARSLLKRRRAVSEYTLLERFPQPPAPMRDAKADDCGI